MSFRKPIIPSIPTADPGTGEAPDIYQTSGNFSGRGAAMSLAVAVVGGGITGLAYGFLTQLIKNPKLDFYAPFLFIYGLSYSIAVVVRKGRIRAPWLAGLIGLTAGVTAEYFNWVGWVHGFQAAGPNSWNLSPAGLWATIKFAGAIGNWKFFGYTAEGGWLWALLALETGGIIFFPAWVCWDHPRRMPFCERCGDWVDDFYSLSLGPAEDSGLLREAIVSQQFAALEDLGLPDKAEETELSVGLCEHCQAIGWLSVAQVEFDKKGKEKKRKEVINNLTITSTAIEQLRALEKKFEPAD